MNKNEIIDILNEFPYSKEEYWLITGTAMVLYDGIKETTHDIDMGCTSKMADALVKDGHSFRITESGNRAFKIGETIEVFENWLFDTYEELDGIQVITLKGLIEMKEELGREKDYRDIELIKAYQATKVSI